MNNLSEIYLNIQSRLFPMVEEEIGELNKKQQLLRCQYTSISYFFFALRLK